MRAGTLVVAAAISIVSGCSSGGQNAVGTGGSVQTGGTGGSTGGAVNGSGGLPSTGGASNGGTSNGGTSNGGTSNGGAATGGTSSGGTSSGGTSSGGTTGTTETVYVSDLCELANATNAWGPVEKDRSNGEEAGYDGGPITVAGTLYSKGLGMHAAADIGYAIGGNCSTFTATVGLDDEVRDAGSVIFEVWGDGQRLYQSSARTGADAALPISVDISGVNEIHLVANPNGGNGSDHADWADAKITCAPAPSSRCAARPPMLIPGGYHLAWSDEFDVEGRPNAANWKFEHGFVRNEEAQWYQENNASVKAGFLIIEGRREQVLNPNYQAGSTDWKLNRQYADYSSSSLLTQGLQSFQYGRFEMRARIVAQNGLWPAFWTLGNSGEWPSNGEIDIMEYYGGAVHANVACGTTTRWVAKWDSASRAVSSFNVADWDHKFHTWRMDWNDTTITLYIDDIQMNTTNLVDMLNPDGTSPFRQKAYILVNLAIGGNAGGDPSSTPFPSRYEIDYVRVFQQ